MLPFAPQIPSSTVFMKGGDLIWVPPGWAHRVLTIRKSMGIGAFYVHPAIAVESVELSRLFSPDCNLRFLKIESCLNAIAYGLADAYVKHSNIVALHKQCDPNYEAPEQNSTDLRVANQDHHYLLILRNIFLPNIGKEGAFAKFRDTVTEAARRVQVWEKHQNRGAHIYPEDAKDIHHE